MTAVAFPMHAAIAADTVIAYIAHDDRPNISSASSWHGAKHNCIGRIASTAGSQHCSAAYCYRCRDCARLCWAHDKVGGIPMVSIAAHTDYATPGCGAHLRFTGLEPQWACVRRYGRGGRHLFHNRHLPGCYTATKVHCLVTEAHGCEQLAHSRYAAAPGRGSNPRPLDRKSDTLALHHYVIQIVQKHRHTNHGTCNVFTGSSSLHPCSVF